MGDNGILSLASKAKIAQEDKSAEEELMLAWSAKMAKFYEDVASGKAKPEDIYKYFNEFEINKMMGNGGLIYSLIYDSEKNTFSFNYVSSDGIPYIGEIKSTGEVKELKRAQGVTTEVWASFYEPLKILTYASSKDIKLEGQTPTYQWDLTEGFNDVYDVPWSPNDDDSEECYADNITKVQVLDEIIPKNTDMMFYFLDNCETFEGLENIDYTYCRMIGMGQFAACQNLKSITIPSTVRYIDTAAFFYCTQLEEVNLNNNIAIINENAFNRCISLKRIDLSDTLLSIEAEAFAYTGLEEITIPESVEYLGEYCFNYCDSLKTVNYNAIDSETNMYVSEEILHNRPFTNNIETINIGNSVRNLDAYLFLGTNVKNLTIPGSINTIEFQTFSWCEELETVIIEEGVEKISGSAFKGDTNLIEVTFPQSLKYIEDNAFFSCESLEEITIPENVKSIGKAAFCWCTSLETVNYNAIDASETDLIVSDEDDVITMTPIFGIVDDSLETINIGSSVRRIPTGMFISNTAMYINIEEGLQYIGYGAFAHSEELVAISIPSTIEEISPTAFFDCPFLMLIWILKEPEVVNSMSGYPWSNNSITEIYTL